MAAPLEIQENTILVILGASGDLAKKKLVSPTRYIPTFTVNADVLASSQHSSAS